MHNILSFVTAFFKKKKQKPRSGIHNLKAAGAVAHSSDISKPYHPFFHMAALQVGAVYSASAAQKLKPQEIQ